MTILFYSPFNNRSRDTESLMLAFKDQGHKVISLSQAEGNFIHPFLEKNGIETKIFIPKNTSTIISTCKHLIYFIFFCYRRKIDIVYSHLESANFIAAMGQYFIPSKVFLCRHHIDEAALRGFDRTLYYRLTYWLAKKVIVVSDRALNHLIVKESIRKNKILKINLAYDFKLYNQPDPMETARIRAEAQADLLLLTAGRLTKFKRADLSIRVLSQLLKKGLNAKLILLGLGERENELIATSESLGVREKIFFMGYVQNVVDFIAASDFLVHPSVLESSCVIVKEAALIKKPVIVCSGVGDFDEYMVGRENGFTLNKDNFVDEAVEVILESYNKKDWLQAMGERLNKKVLELFSIEKIISQYDQLNTRE